MKTRIIHTKFWADDYISALTPVEKLIFIYYLTNDRVNIIHCFECPDKYVLVDTGVSREVLQRCKEKFESDGKMKFYSGYVLLINADKYERYFGPDNEKKKQTLLAEMSQDVLDWYNNKNNTPVDRGVTPLYTGTINHNSKTINYKLKSLTINYEKIISVFNERFGSSYQLTEGRKEKIRVRLKTFTEEQIIAAIIGMSQNKFYQGDNKTGWKADPDYLLRSDEIIDRFINSKISGKSIADTVREAQQ